ncbi:heme-binding protein 2 isoform X3 [Myripristis murdjan]|uniref:heme-binding protein 2 isoform X3 n=1 Tax=Myripristis murdjan TaxID=586833 RepID=UPI001176286E|nr:uncharacterized protein LOC115355987 isoform X3 [Myripristis murdjan]
MINSTRSSNNRVEPTGEEMSYTDGDRETAAATGSMLRALGQVLFSSGLQSPRFTTEEGQGQDYEVRTYQATKWVSTSMTGMQWDVATRTGFHRLFDYIQGNNQSSVTRHQLQLDSTGTDHRSTHQPYHYTAQVQRPEHRSYSFLIKVKCVTKHCCK